MATTGFWPVKGSLKKVIDYAENPDKTTNRKYLDEDLFRALRYVKNDSKTDRRMYVSGINCPTKRAYEHMMTTKRQYGKMGGNVAYHGYQSFTADEVTPEEAHRIGIETAKRMWGDKYQIVVTTHLNTDNVHNHMVINSVSFKTGRKFENHIHDHIRLREISDEVCLEHGKGILKDSSFYGRTKKEYWIQKSGGMSRRDILKQDVEHCLSLSGNPREFEARMKAQGYRIIRSGEQYKHISVIAPGWQRAIRLSSIGYTNEVLNDRMRFNMLDDDAFRRKIGAPLEKPRYTPLMEFEREYRKAMRMDSIQLTFALIIALLRWATGTPEQQKRQKPLSPAMRQEVAKMEQYAKQYRLLSENDIHSGEELVSFISDTEQQIKSLEAQRQQLRNRLRRVKTPEEKSELKQACKALSAQMKPLRERKKTAEKIIENTPKLQELLETERQMEEAVRIKERNNRYER
ncbi:MAG: relaxase/mobilization nuclease domain-containing protein [Oscillospiraceae bacterium]|nr:relaxase/mobilization nuclease domain-containing protein [Oscillospiraceae bacterium]